MKILAAIGLFLSLSAHADGGRCQNIAETTALKAEANDNGPGFNCSLRAPTEPGEETEVKAVYVVHTKCTPLKAQRRRLPLVEMDYPLTVEIVNGECGAAHLVLFQ